MLEDVVLPATKTDFLLSCPVVVCHRPCDGYETKKERESFRLPAGSICDVSEYPFSGLFIRSQNEEGNAYRNRGKHCKNR